MLISARRVGLSGRAIGVDMTDEMLELARRSAADAGAQNVEFVKGAIEDLPLPDASVDVVISTASSISRPTNQQCCVRRPECCARKGASRSPT